MASLTLRIGPNSYDLRAAARGESGSPPPGGWLLRKLEEGPATAYRAGLDHCGRPHCDCPDYKHRRHALGEQCKHLDALHALGLLGSLTE